VPKLAIADPEVARYVAVTFTPAEYACLLDRSVIEERPIEQVIRWRLRFLLRTVASSAQPKQQQRASNAAVPVQPPAEPAPV
jgi:hypothetical protein